MGAANWRSLSRCCRTWRRSLIIEDEVQARCAARWRRFTISMAHLTHPGAGALTHPALSHWRAHRQPGWTRLSEYGCSGLARAREVGG